MRPAGPLDLRFSRVGPHTWAGIGEGDDIFHSYGANQGLVEGKRLGIIVDSGFHNPVAREILHHVQTRTRTTLVVNTHYHSDHIFGNGIFAETGAAIIAHEKCGRSMHARSEDLLAIYRKRDRRLSRLLQGVRIAYPSITYQDRLTAHLDDGFQAMIIHPPVRAHTDGDSIVHVPRERVVFAGDVLWVGYHPNLEDADVQGQIQALRMILRLNPRRIVPGHGPVSGPRGVKRLIKYLEELDRNIRSGTRKGLRGDEFVRHVIPRWSWDWKMRWLMESYISNLARKN